MHKSQFSISCWQNNYLHACPMQIIKKLIYSHSRKTVSTRENFWNVYCFATNQKRDETAEDNRQAAAWISLDFIRNNELGLSSTKNLQFYRFQILKLFFSVFQLIYVQ